MDVLALAVYSVGLRTALSSSSCCLGFCCTMQQSLDLKIALVGDSVLDDHYWLEHPANDVRAQTERTLKLAYPDRPVQVHNYAVDESTVACVLYGRAPAAAFVNARKKALMEPYPLEADGLVKPLLLLRKLKPTHVVSGTVMRKGRERRESVICMFTKIWSLV